MHASPMQPIVSSLVHSLRESWTECTHQEHATCNACGKNNFQKTLCINLFKIYSVGSSYSSVLYIQHIDFHLHFLYKMLNRSHDFELGHWHFPSTKPTAKHSLYCFVTVEPFLWSNRLKISALGEKEHLPTELGEILHMSIFLSSWLGEKGHISTFQFDDLTKVPCACHCMYSHQPIQGSQPFSRAWVRWVLVGARDFWACLVVM